MSVQTIRLSPEQYAQALSFVLPGSALNPISTIIETVAAKAAAAVVKDARFQAAWNADNMRLAGTLFHSAAANELRALPPSKLPPGWSISAEKTLKSGAGGGRADVFIEGPQGELIEIDWKTTGLSALSSRTQTQMAKHQGQVKALKNGATLTAQQSRSWIDYVLPLMP